MSARDLFDLVGTTIAGKFRVERVLGEGGFGVVYAGTHVLLGERVAIKCLKPLGYTPADRERGAQAFLREARILFGLGHPAIVRLYDVGVIENGQVPYVVLELLSGTTLEAEIGARAAARRPFSRDELVSLFVPILEAVGFAHERGIVHRDLKPSNLMLVTEGGRLQPKVLDFGTARSDNAGTGRAGGPLPDASLGKTGFTPLYAAPEQWDAVYGATGARTDVFALGLTIAEACLLRYPLEISAGNILSVFKASLDDSSRPLLAQVRPDLPLDLERVVLRSMRARPEQRYADARELLVGFRAAFKLAPSTAPLAAPLAPSYPPHPPLPSASPPLPPPMVMVGASTTQGQSLATYGAPSAPQRASALPWVIGIGVAVATLAMVVVGVVVLVVVLPSRAAAPVATADPPKGPVPAAAPTAPPASPAAAGAPASPAARGGAAPAAPAPGGAVATGPAPRIILSDAIGMAPFWTQADVMDVARAHQGEMVGCAREAIAAQPGLQGPVDVTVSPNKNGVVESVQCSMRVHNTAGESAMCGCVASVMGKWKYPAARGKLGLLDAGPFIYDYKLFPP